MELSTTTGIELELWVVDDRGRLSDGRGFAEAHERIEPEFVEPLIEVRTEPHDTEAGLRRDLQEVLETAIEAAATGGRHLVPLGTPLTGTDSPATTTRGKLFERIYGEGIESAKNCAGTHIHFEKGAVRRQLNLLTALDPALALVSSSPYYKGERDMASSRAFAYRKECGPRFRRFCDLWEYTDSVEEWEDRVENVFETFHEIARESGLSAETVDDFFGPENAMLNPVRLRTAQPTVEWRAPDAALPSQIIRLARDASRLVEQTTTKRIEFGPPNVTAEAITVPEFSDLRALSRQAIRNGLQPDPVTEYLRTLGFDPDDYDPISPTLRGPPVLATSTARELRLQYAGLLREDVGLLTADAPGEQPDPPDLQLA